MLADISFLSKEEFLEDTSGGSVPHAERVAFWENRFSPEKVAEARVQKGIYRGLSASSIDAWSHYETVTNYDQTFDEVIEKNLSGPLIEQYGWYGRAKSIDAILKYLKPCIDMPDRKFVVGIFHHEEDWEKSYKCGAFVEETEDWDCAPFWAFTMHEVIKTPK